GAAGRRSRNARGDDCQSARAPVLRHRRPRFDDLLERARHQQRHAAVRARSRDRRRRGRRADGDRRSGAAAAARHAVAADVPQGQSRGAADLRRRAQLRDAAAVGRRRVRRDAHRAADRGDRRRGADQRARRPEVRRPRAGRSRAPARAEHRHQRNRSVSPELEREPADRSALRRHAHADDQGQRPVDERRRVPPVDRGGAQRRARAPPAGRGGDRQRRGHAQRLLAVRPGRRPPRRPRLRDEAAGQQHACGHRRDPSRAPADSRSVAAARAAHRRHRPRRLHPRRVPRHQDHDGGHARARRLRHLPLPAQRPGDAHPGARAAGLDPRHVRGDAAAPLQSQQPVADGRDPLVRLRRRRCDRDARKYRAAHRGWRRSADGDARRFARSGLHDRQHDDLARRRFIPVLFLGGILGRLFREFAVTITTAVLLSGLVSVTLTPVLCSRILRRRDGAAHRPEPVFAVVRNGYARSLRVALRHRGAALVQTVGNIVRRNPNLQRAVAFVGNGPGGAGAMNTARVVLRMKPRADRVNTAQEIVQQTRPLLARFPGFRTFVTLPPAFQIGGRQGDNSYSVTLQSPDTGELYAWADRFQKSVAALPSVQDVSSDLEIKSPRVRLIIDRDKAAALALDPTRISTALYGGFGPRWSSTIYGDVAQYRVLLELAPRYQESVSALQSVSFKSTRGVMVPLEAVVTPREDLSPQTVNHSGQLPAVGISFGLRPGVALGDAVDEIRREASATLPASMSVHFEGTARAFEDSVRNLGLLLFVAIGVVYIVLGMLYESFIHPLTILSGLPSAGLGALVTLVLFGNELNAYSFVGLIMLVGIVNKNAIMQIDVALDEQRRHGRSAADAIYEGCIVRFRPIMMTTMAALLGAAPI